MRNISQYLLERINYMFLFFIGLTFIGAIRSSNLNLSVIPKKFVLLLALSILIVFIICTHSTLKKRSIEFIDNFFTYFKKRIVLITIIIFTSMLLSQIFILANVTTHIGWDVGTIISGVRNPKSINDYLSYYPNNQLYFFGMYVYNKIVSSVITSLNGCWIIFQLLNIVFIDTSAVILFKATKNLFDKKSAYLTLYLYMFLFMLSPWIMVPYTDQISLFLTCIVLYLFSNMKNIFGPTLYLTLTIVGITIGISFLIKPSSIIYVIAYFIMEILKWIKKSSFSIKNILLIILLLFSFCLPLIGFKQFISNQEIVKIDSQKSMSWTHFVMMGLTGSGGYNSNDVKRDKQIIDPILRKRSNIEVIKQRLEDHKVSGYISFLIQKHFNNTDRGDFGWGRDGTPQVPEKVSRSSLQSFLRDAYYQQGRKTNIIRLYMQIIWIIIIIGMMYSFKISEKPDTLLCMKLTIIGAFLYLLIFEGGRSRYLIQYLPFFLVISSVGFTSSLKCEKIISKPTEISKTKIFKNGLQ